MPIFVNPFKKHDVSDFENIFIPLAQAQRSPSVIAAHDSKLGTKDGFPVADTDAEKGSEAAATTEAYSAYTIEGLRAEIDSDITASGHDTAYDRM